MTKIIKYYRDESDFTKFHSQLPQQICSFCHQVGTLILNGLLKGQHESPENCNTRVRGHRILCNSRRKHHQGCGKSFSVYLSDTIKGIVLSAASFWKFLVCILQGCRCYSALSNSNLNITYNGIKKLFNKFKQRQSIIRSSLQEQSPPPEIQSKNPLIQLLYHLQQTFPKSINPISDFQLSFQQSFL